MRRTNVDIGSRPPSSGGTRTAGDRLYEIAVHADHVPGRSYRKWVAQKARHGGVCQSRYRARSRHGRRWGRGTARHRSGHNACGPKAHESLAPRRAPEKAYPAVSFRTIPRVLALSAIVLTSVRFPPSSRAVSHLGHDRAVVPWYGPPKDESFRGPFVLVPSLALFA
jgi:hypothetical protein